MPDNIAETFGGSAKFSVYEIVGNFKLPSIVRASDGKVIAPRPDQLVARAVVPNDNGNTDDVDAIAFVKGHNFLDACLPRRDKNAESEAMQKLTVGEAFDAIPQFGRQTWGTLPGQGTTDVSLEFVITNKSGKRSQAKIIFSPTMAPRDTVRTSSPSGVWIDGVPQGGTTAFFNTICDQLDNR
ncbi:MAG: hypothetical protein ACRC46_04925 [Thermoguttaceae bacterium]